MTPEEKIADLKANFDYVLEGKYLELKEKDRQLNNWYLEWQKQEKRITELEQENNKLLDVINNQDIKIVDLEQKLEQTEKDLADYQFNYPKIKELEKTIKLLGERCNQLLKDKGELIDRCEELQEQNSHMFNTIALQEQQIEKMKCCANCKYGYCGGSSISIDKNGNRTFHNWNEEKQECCDVGFEGKYQCWELEE